MPKLRVLLVSMHTSPAEEPGSGDAGGMNVVERHTAIALARIGFDVEIVTRRADPKTPTRVELAPGVILRHLDAGPPTPLAKSQIDAHLDEFAAGVLALEPPSLIHSHHWMSGIAALPAARRWGVPHVQSYHSVAALPGSPLAEGEPPESPARVPGEAQIAVESDAIVAVSTAEARTIVERCGADPNRVTVIPPGVDLEVFRPKTPGEPRPSEPWAEDPYVLFASRLQPLKGADLAIRALAALPAARRPTLVISGDTSADFAQYADQLDELIESTGLADKVVLIGPRPHKTLAELMRHAEVFLVPSHSETFGLVALEAAASGTPVIASATGGLREVVVHSETGLLMLQRDPVAWARGLESLLSKPALMARYGEVARIHARRFTWQRSAELLAVQYRELIHGIRQEQGIPTLE